MYTLKIAKPGFSVTKDNSASNLPTERKPTEIHLYSPFIQIFLNGARKQIQRIRHLTENDTLIQDIPNTLECYHEFFTLLEDLATISHYIKKCGDITKQEQQKLWTDLRNHIRHDIREEFDNTDDRRKSDRAKQLGLDPALQMDIRFDAGKIKIGSIVIKLTEIEKYLNWVNEFNTKLITNNKERFN